MNMALHVAGAELLNTIGRFKSAISNFRGTHPGRMISSTFARLSSTCAPNDTETCAVKHSKH
jgi:hypothetical protein